MDWRKHHTRHCLPTTTGWYHSQKHKEESATTPDYLPSVGCRQSTVSWSCNDLERWTECSKPSWGQLGGTSSKLQKPGQLFLCETGDHSPKPPHDLLQTRKSKARSAKEIKQAHQQLTRISVNCSLKQVLLLDLICFTRLTHRGKYYIVPNQLRDVPHYYLPPILSLKAERLLLLLLSLQRFYF